jgi:hypothetical protein
MIEQQPTTPDRLDTIDTLWRDTGQLSRSDIAWLIAKAHEFRADGRRITTTVDVWLLAADQQGIWRCNPDLPWSSLPLDDTGDPTPAQTAAEIELIQHQVNLSRLRFFHSTSWRSQPETVLHFLAAVKVDGPVRVEYPDAKPVSFRLHELVGQPRTHAALGPPTEHRYIDHVRHGIRHMRYLTDPDSDGYDATIAERMFGGPPESWDPADPWMRHLPRLRGATARMFGQVHQSA